MTTSPPTESVLTGEDGTFTIEDVSTGNYAVDVSKTDYEPRSVQVKVQENQTTSAVVLLERTEDTGPQSDTLAVQVSNWYTDRVNRDSTGQDSLFADVEYTVRNVGGDRIQRYEVYFEIDTSDGVFSQEATGDSLAVDQRDVRGFRKYITAEADEVRVEDVYWEASSD